jgi:hypothetical protein
MIAAGINTLLYIHLKIVFPGKHTKRRCGPRGEQNMPFPLPFP